MSKPIIDGDSSDTTNATTNSTKNPNLHRLERQLAFTRPIISFMLMNEPPYSRRVCGQDRKRPCRALLYVLRIMPSEPSRHLL